MDNVVCFCKALLACWTNSNYHHGKFAKVARVLTRGKHALYEVVDIAKHNPEALWSALLTSKRLDLDTL